MKAPKFHAAFAWSLATISVAAAGTAAANPPPLFPGKSELAKPPMPTRDSIGLTYSGTVTEVTKSSITIQWPGETPKTFSVSETLASGGFPKQGRLRFDGSRPSVLPSFCYRLHDVKVNDHVYITFAHLGGTDICDEICISKRPGGRVPPLPKGAEPLKSPAGIDLIPYHERKNAYWDLEDKGIPYPEKFGKDRRWPAAPMPREVKPGPDTP
jgi:hypothetical protein